MKRQEVEGVIMSMKHNDMKIQKTERSVAQTDEEVQSHRILLRNNTMINRLAPLEPLRIKGSDIKSR